jgi:hypothetical protein
MKRDSEAQLLQFCVAQRRAFAAEAWSSYVDLPRDELAVTAVFLAGVGWYGHRDELLAVAHSLAAGCVGRFSELASQTEFDCSRFSHSLRRLLDP